MRWRLAARKITHVQGKEGCQIGRGRNQVDIVSVNVFTVLTKTSESRAAIGVVILGKMSKMARENVYWS